jgi:lipopolysaccharide/colanic/teichoic acid biosynthesis glycosyltransferase
MSFFPHGIPLSKRVFDLALTLPGLILISPVLAVVAGLVAIFHGRPVLFRQIRPGHLARPFAVWKFRTMTDTRDTQGNLLPDAARLTRLGHFLRVTSLDELPELFNVLRGEMSLVGPRPERPEFVRQFRERIPQYMLRHRVKSGMTGWAQVNGWRGNTSLEKRIEFDLYYIENWSLLLEFKILILTLFRGFGQKHAY